MIKKIFSVLLCAVFIPAVISGCSSEESSSEEMTYGEAVKEVDRDDIYLIYDGRFIEDEEMETLVNYYLSIQNKDLELFKSTQPKTYIDFLDEQENFELEDFIGTECQEIETELGSGYNFSQIEVSDCGDSSSDNGINDIKELLDGIYSDAGMEKSFSDTVKSAKYLVYDIKAMDTEGSEYDLTNQMKYIFTCDDGIYIF